jgi:hypothetical protein
VPGAGPGARRARDRERAEGGAFRWPTARTRQRGARPPVHPPAFARQLTPSLPPSIPPLLLTHPPRPPTPAPLAARRRPSTRARATR